MLKQVVHLISMLSISLECRVIKFFVFFGQNRPSVRIQVKVLLVITSCIQTISRHTVLDSIVGESTTLAAALLFSVLMVSQLGCHVDVVVLIYHQQNHSVLFSLIT